MLGLNLGLNKNNFVQKKYILDKLENANNCVLGFSIYRLTNKYKGNCLKVRRSSDNNTLNIGFDNDGYIDVSALETFCSGTDGFVHTWYNQSQSIGVQDAIQTTNNYQPKIVSSGSFLTNGLKFDGSDDSLKVLNYSALNTLGQNLTFFYKVKILSIPSYPNEGMIFSKNRWNQYRCGSFYNTNDRFNMKADSIVENDMPYTLDVLYNRLITYDGSNVKDYKNGVLDNTLPLTGDVVSSVNDLYFGSHEQLNTFLNYQIRCLLFFNNNQYSNYSDLAGGV